MCTVLTIADNTTAQDFTATTPYGYTVVIEYADHAYSGSIERIHNVNSINWLFNIEQGLTGLGSGEVAYDSSAHGFGGCLRFYDQLDGQLVERFKRLTVEPATNWSPVPCESWKGSQQLTEREKYEHVVADMAKEYVLEIQGYSMWDFAPLAHRADLIQAFALGMARFDDYPRNYQACRAQDELGVRKIERASTDAHFAYWSQKVTVGGVDYMLGFEYGD